jgi:hypothetical protein
VQVSEIQPGDRVKVRPPDDTFRLRSITATVTKDLTTPGSVGVSVIELDFSWRRPRWLYRRYRLELVAPDGQRRLVYYFMRVWVTRIPR